MTLAAGDIGIDYSYARPPIADIVKDGAKFVIRYSAGAASDPHNGSHADNAGKLITPAEFKALLHAGLDVIANDEWYESRVTEGYAAGKMDGKAATALWRSCGLAKGATVYCSWDAAPNAGQYRAVRRYLRGWKAGSGGYYVPDLYGGTPVLRNLLSKVNPLRTVYRIRYGWRPNAGSWSSDGLPYQPDTKPAQRASLVVLAAKATPAHIWQTGNYWFSKSADENLIVRVPVGSHRETLTVKPQPVPPPVPPTKPDVPTPHYPAPTAYAHAIVSADRQWATFINNDGKLDVRHIGEHERNL